MVTATVLAVVVAFVLFWPRAGRDWRSSGAVLALGLWLAVRSPMGSVSRPARAGTGESIPGNPNDRVVVEPAKSIAEVLEEAERYAVGDATTEELPDLGELLRPEQLQPDEIYISYDEDGRRKLVTTGEHDLTELLPGWYREVTRPISVVDFSRYLANHGGAARWSRLGDSVGAADDTSLDHDGYGDDAWAGYGRGTGAYPGHLGARPDGAGHHRWDPSGGGDVPQRAHAGRAGIRSHRHCPGCTGHRGVNHGAGIAILRILAAFGVGWGVVWLGGQAEVPVFQGIDLFEYLYMMCGATLVWMLLKGALRGA